MKATIHLRNYNILNINNEKRMKKNSKSKSNTKQNNIKENIEIESSLNLEGFSSHRSLMMKEFYSCTKFSYIYSLISFLISLFICSFILLFFG